MGSDLLTATFGEFAQQLTLGIVEFRWNSDHDSSAQVSTSA
jgi:hypothetical protein